MTKSNERDGGPVPKWMRLLVEKWRVDDWTDATWLALFETRDRHRSVE
jgi:hypothetical protein